MDRGMVHDLGGIEQDRMRLLHATQNSSSLKTYGLLISGIFHLIFSDQVWLQVSETLESETTDEGRLLYLLSINFLVRDRHSETVVSKTRSSPQGLNRPTRKKGKNHMVPAPWSSTLSSGLLSLPGEVWLLSEFFVYLFNVISLAILEHGFLKFVFRSQCPTYLLFSFFWLHHPACGILVPQPRIEFIPPALSLYGVLTAGPAAKYPYLFTFDP